MQNGRLQTMKVTGSLIFSSSSMVVQAALDHYGLAWIPEASAQQYIDNQSLMTVLDDCAVIFTGYHLYYPSRNVSPAIRVIVDALKI